MTLPSFPWPNGLKHARFDSDTERLFVHRRIERTLPTIRFGCVAACIIFGAFFLRDRYLAPSQGAVLTAIRLVICGFYLAMIPVTSSARSFPYLPALVPIGASAGTISVSIICTLIPQGFYIGIGGPLLIIMAAAAIAPTATSAAMTCLAAIVIPNVAMLLTHQPWIIVFSSNHYLVLGSLLSIGIAVIVEEGARRAFLLELELEKAATTDPLTGVCNRRRFLEIAEAELARARRYGHPLSFIMLDLDHFKLINDRFGHAGGDAALKQLPSRFQTFLRRNDVVGRLGGEEFAILLPETEAERATAVAERLRSAVAGEPIDAVGRPTHLTLSAGCVQVVDGDADVDAVLKRADEALYAAKRAGRNRVEVG